MKLWKKCLSGILTTAMLVGLVPTSALAVHAPGTDTGDLGLAQEVSLFINETNPDDELQSADALGYSRTPYNNEESYPYVIPITEGQNTADIYSKARVTMSSQTAQHLMNDVQNLDVEQTRFVVFMAIDENMTLTGNKLLFNSTFLMPDEEQMNKFASYNEKGSSALTVTKATSEEYTSDYSSDTATDMGWVISGDLEALYIPNPYEVTTGNSNASGFSFQDNFFAEENYPYYDYVKSRNSDSYLGPQAGKDMDLLWSDFVTNSGADRVSNVKFYAIPVKMNWSALANTEDAAREIYKEFSEEDWMCPMQLSVPENLSKTQPYDGIKIAINVGNPTGNDLNLTGTNASINRDRSNFGLAPSELSATGIDTFIPTVSDIANRNGKVFDEPLGFVNSMPIAGAIVGSIKSTNGGFIGNDVQTMQTGHIYIQFTKPVTGDIVVEKTIQIQEGVELSDAQISALSDLNGTTLGITVTNVDGDEVAEGNTLTLAWNQEAQTLTASTTLSGLSSDTTYDVSVDAEIAKTLEDAGLYLQGGIQVSGGEDIDLSDYYQLTRNADGTVNTSGLIEAGKVPTVTVTSTYGTEKPVVPSVTLTYDPNGGDGPNRTETKELVDEKAEFTVIDNPFTRDEADGVTYTFDGWNTQANGGGTDYAPDDQIILTEDETLYAQWKAEGEEPVEPPATMISKTLSGNLDKDNQTDVTLSIPSKGSEQTVDVVLAMDCTSLLAEHGADVIQNIGTLGDELLEKNINLSVGVVGFGRESRVVHELTALNKGNSDSWAADIAADIWENQAWFLNNVGTNIQGGIRMAQEVLDRSTTGADENHKYIVLITDGGAYWYCRNDTDDTPVTTAHKGDKLQSMSNMDATPDWVGDYVGGDLRSNDSLYLRHIAEGGNFASFMDKYGSDIEASANGKSFSLEETTAANAAGPDTDDETLKQVWDNAFTTAEVRNFDAYPFINMERGTYFAAQELLDAKNAGSKIITIGYPYDAGLISDSLEAASSGFLEWTGTIGDYYDGDKLDSAFSDLADQIAYFVDAGSYVIDEMGSGTDKGWAYDFDFVNDAQYLTLTVGGETLAVTSLGENSYGFGDPNGSADGSTYPFVLTYSPAEEPNDSFRLDINVPVLASEPVQLTYRVKQVNEADGNVHGQYDPDGSQEFSGLYTNTGATLYPQGGTAMEFPNPTVSCGSVLITPADITIYTGGDGYDSVVNGSGNEIGTTNNGLPTPGFYIELPAEVNDWLIGQAADEDKVINDEGDVVVDLSKYLTFTYDDGQGNTRTWHLERYDNKEGNDSMAYNRYIYRILPAEVNGEEIPIRLQFTDDDGAFMTSDDFAVNLNDLYHEYNMTIYAGDLNQQLVKAVLTVNDAATEYDATVESGELTVRGVTDNDTHYTTVEDSVPENVDSVTLQVGENAKFFINGSQLEVLDPSAVKLLVDSHVPDSSNTLINSALDEFEAIPNDYDYEARYLDLVDTSNGNAYVTAKDTDLTVYWAYPEGTDENTEFHLVHYVGLDRNSNDDLANGTYTMEYYSIGNGLEATEQGIRFTVDSFSPFTLFWEDDSNNGGGGSSGGGGGGGGGGDSKPELNKEDHIAYVSGYPDGTVQPEGYITREEVATIFFRLLTDESRADFITDYNPYPDVASDRWSYYAITTMTNGNLMLGRTGGVFDPGANITRAEFAVVAAQFSNAQYSGPDKFTDISDHWARDYINRAANEGWIAGYPDGTFGPDRFITRAEVMALVNEVLERAPDADYMLDNMTVWPDNPKSAWYYEDVQEATNSHSYVWRNTQHTSEDWEDFISMRTFNELVRDAFNAAN